MRCGGTEPNRVLCESRRNRYRRAQPVLSRPSASVEYLSVSLFSERAMPCPGERRALERTPKSLGVGNLALLASLEQPRLRAGTTRDEFRRWCRPTLYVAVWPAGSGGQGNGGWGGLPTIVSVCKYGLIKYTSLHLLVVFALVHSMSLYGRMDAIQQRITGNRHPVARGHQALARAYTTGPQVRTSSVPRSTTEPRHDRGLSAGTRRGALGTPLADPRAPSGSLRSGRVRRNR